MARISTYAAIAATAQDTLLGTDVGSGLATKNYTVQSIVDLIPGIVPGGGTVTTVGINVIGDAYIGTVVNPTTTPAIAVTPQGTASQYINGLGNLITFPAGGGISLAVDRTSGASTLVGSILNIPNYLNDASIVKTSGVQTIAGAKTFTSNIIANNITNDNTGDQSLSIAGNTLTISGTSSSVTLPTGGTVTSLSVTGASGAAATLISGVLNIPTPVIPTVNFTSLATVGTSGAATLISGVLNIPNYATGSGTFLPLAGGQMTGTISSAAAANLIVKPGTSIIEVQGDGTSTEGAIKLNCALNSHGQTLKAQPHSESITNTMLMPKGANSTLVSEATETGVISISVVQSTSTSVPLTATIVGRTLGITSNAYAGTSNTGFVPAGGSATTFLRGDGTWVTPAGGGGGGSGTVTSVAALTLGTAGTDLASTVANGTTTPVITLNVPTASATNRGALSSTDWTTFNNKTSTTGTVTSVSSSIAGTAFSSNITNASTTPAIAITTNGATTDYINGVGDYIPFPSIPAGTVTSVTGTAPIVSSAGATPAISISTMTAATAGAGGLKGAVPGSAAGDQLKFLRADASWQTIAGGTTVVDNLTTTSATSALSANQGVVLKGLIDTNVTAIGLNTAKTGITGTQAANIVTNNGKTGISSTQAADIVTNNGKTGISSTQSANIVTNNGKVTDTGIPAIKSDGNTPSLNSNITALEVRTLIGAGTSDLAIGTTNTTALAGNTATITTTQADDITTSVKNDTDIYNTPDVEKIISLTQAQYTAITTPDINTLYIII